MSEVLRFRAPGPWITRDLKECVLASDYDALAAQLASYQAARVRDVDEKAWLSARKAELEADVAKWHAAYMELKYPDGPPPFPGVPSSDATQNREGEQ
jgi:hypothetical protein